MWIRPALGAAELAPTRALPVDLAGWAGDTAGAFIGGGLIGLLVQPTWRASVRGGLAASGIRTLADVVIHKDDYPVWFLTLLGLYGGVSLWALWKVRKS